MEKQIVLDVELTDFDVSYDVVQEPTENEQAKVDVTRVELRGVDLTPILKRKEKRLIELNIESQLEDAFHLLARKA